MSLSPEIEAALKEAFNAFDHDGNGSITVEELGNVLRTFGQTPTEEQIKQMIKEVDSDNSGSISFEEFKKNMVEKLLS